MIMGSVLCGIALSVSLSASLNFLRTAHVINKCH